MKRHVTVDAMRTFVVVLEPDVEEGGFVVRVPALPEIVTEGDTEIEALVMAKDAIRLVIDDRVARGQPMPSGIVREVAPSVVNGEEGSASSGSRRVRAIADFRRSRLIGEGQ
jgi:antitoxin HicB